MGTILVTGGTDSTRELYHFIPEAAAGQELVQLNGRLSMARVLHASGLLPNGTAIIVGGTYGNPSQTSDIFDPSTKTIVPGPSMIQSRYAPSGTMLNGKFYVCGEYSNDAVGKKCEVYDPALNSWKPIASSEFNHGLTNLGMQSS